MSNDRKWTRRAAIGFISGGTGLFVLDASAATHIYSDRRVKIGTEDDDRDALLPLDDVSADAEISSSGGEATVYEISEDGWKFTDITPIGLTNDEGDDIDPDDIEVSSSGDGAVVIGCSGSGFSGEYSLTLDLEAKRDDESLSVTVERETNTSIPIDCRPFYSIPENYSDSRENGSGTAAQPPPDEARGVVENSENVGESDGSVATLAQFKPGGGGGKGANVSLKIGFKLPPVEPADCYTLTVEGNIGQGNLNAYLIDERGYRLSDEIQVKNGFPGNTAQVDDGDGGGKISEADTVFLIFEGKGNNNDYNIDFIKLQAGCGS
jgi:hypothetical protein